MHIMPVKDYYKDLLNRGEEEAMPDCCCCDGEHPSVGQGPFVIEKGVVQKVEEVKLTAVEVEADIPPSVPKEFEQRYIGEGCPETCHEEP